MSDSAAPIDRAALRSELGTLTTESVDASLHDLDLRSTESLVHLMNEQDQQVPRAVHAAAPAIVEAVDALTARLRAGGRLLYVGAGTAGRMGVLDASECPPTFGTDPSLVQGIIAGGPTALRSAVENAEDGAGEQDLREVGVGALDAVVGISASGRTPYVADALTHARSEGALTIAVACNAGSRIGELADIAIEVVVGPELISGSTRLKSGTAQKLVLNMLTTLTMVRLGKTYGNIMVDLRATNEKLRARAEHTVMMLTGADAEAAASALRKADGSTKLALLILATGLPAQDARDVLEAQDGHLRRALESQSAELLL
ncbi:N-acetylmuramic acid 6-phosphate etherase [Brachybacterium sacelli]|uniref:N-acetylmuramic acid 6-phosphate etherase n=1 Tax=Brachybacterium sacelli TaxID=173364 RepID=A0ABS4WZJ3_9MICO|nr:N-acetylmuramic acid 6-phosphate etherase [Brachybacterium sacelli]